MTRLRFSAVLAVLAAAGFAATFVTASQSLIEQNATVIAQVSGYLKQTETLTWAPVAGVSGYDLIRDGVKVSNAGPAATSAKFVVQPGQHTLAVRTAYPTPPPTTTTTATTTPTTTTVPTTTATTTTTPTTTATLPSTATETMGETAVLPSGDSGNGNHIYAQQAGLAQDGTLQSLSFYVTSAAGKLRLAVYDSSGAGGGPGALKAQTAEITPVANSWNTAPVPSVNLTAGYYWLAYLPSDNGLGFRVASGGPYKGYAYPYAAPPATFDPSAGSGPSHWSFYATLATSAAPPSTATTRLAWFYSRALDGTTPFTIVQKHQVMILSGSDSEVGYLSQIRSAGWTKPILEYVDEALAMGPSSAMTGTCAAGYSGYTTSWTSTTDDFCNKVNPNESWFLHNGAGKRIFRDAGGGSYFYLMNAASAGWRAFVQAKTASLPATYHMDGVFLDDVWATAINARSREANSDGTCQECGTDAQWLQAQVGMLQAVKAGAGSHPVWINSDNTTTLAQLVDGFMVENMGASWGTSFMGQPEIEQRMADVEANTSAGKDTILVGQGNQADTERMRFSHALYLLVSGPHVSYRFQNAGDYRAFWDYPEFHIDLGAPAGARFAVGASVWRRDFANGTAVANVSSTASQTVSLGGTYTLPGGGTASSVTLAPDHGMTLTR